MLISKKWEKKKGFGSSMGKDDFSECIVVGSECLGLFLDTKWRAKDSIFLMCEWVGRAETSWKKPFFAEILIAYLYQHFGAKLEVFMVIFQEGQSYGSWWL